ncbi:MAG: hypothetical protein ACLQU3_32640 [Limisphaerales bacterium]
MKIPAHFPKWNRAIDGLDCSGKWVMDCERSRLPPDMVFPRVGQVWETIRDCEVQFHACISPRSELDTAGLPKGFAHLGPIDLKSYMMQFGMTQLRRGERVRILEVGPKPLVIFFRPLRYHELHESIVPEKIRRMPGYNGYTLHLKTAKTISDLCWVSHPGQTFFNEAFRLVVDVA